MRRSTTTQKVIVALSQIFARFGFPHSLKSDNGPQSVSEDFQKYLLENGIEHRKSPALWPQANGEVERQNRILLKALGVSMFGRELKTKLPELRRKDSILNQTTKERDWRQLSRYRHCYQAC